MGADPPDADPGSGALSRIEEDPTVSECVEPSEVAADEPETEERDAGDEAFKSGVRPASDEPEESSAPF